MNGRNYFTIIHYNVRALLLSVTSFMFIYYFGGGMLSTNGSLGQAIDMPMDGHK